MYDNVHAKHSSKLTCLKSNQQAKSKNIQIETTKSTSDADNLFMQNTRWIFTKNQEIRNAEEQICWIYSTKISQV